MHNVKKNSGGHVVGCVNSVVITISHLEHAAATTSPLIVILLGWVPARIFFLDEV